MEHDQPATPRALHVELIDLTTGTMVLSIADEPLGPVPWPAAPIRSDPVPTIAAPVVRAAGRVRTCQHHPTGGRTAT